MTLPDDTQPRSPFKTPPHVPVVTVQPPDDETELEPVRSGPGCLVWGLMSVVGVGFALLIIILAVLAGWSSGQRVAQTNATATQNAAINEQFIHIPTDVSSGNQILINARIQYLIVLTPGVPGMNDIILTATAVSINNQPTATLTLAVTTTPEATENVIVAETTQAPSSIQSSGTLDLPALLTEAQNAIAVRDWDTAIDRLDIILASDSTFETGSVRSLMSQALVEKANELLLSADLSDLAEGVILTDRAREFGSVDRINYESIIAAEYLDGIAAIGINYPLAIQKLSSVYSQVPDYKDVRQQLFNQYLSYGDAWVAQGEYCPAAGQYQAALGILNDPGTSAKLTNAQTMCSQATPVGAPPGTVLPGTAQPIAPIGVG
jgi:hypothetical protein